MIGRAEAKQIKILTRHLKITVMGWKIQFYLCSVSVAICFDCYYCECTSPLHWSLACPLVDCCLIPVLIASCHTAWYRHISSCYYHSPLCLPVALSARQWTDTTAPPVAQSPLPNGGINICFSLGIFFKWTHAGYLVSGTSLPFFSPDSTRESALTFDTSPMIFKSQSTVSWCLNPSGSKW